MIFSHSALILPQCSISYSWSEHGISTHASDAATKESTMLLVTVSTYALVDPSLSSEFDRHLVLHLFSPMPVLLGAPFVLILGAPATRLEFNRVTISTRKGKRPTALLSPKAAQRLNVAHLLPNWACLHVPVPEASEILHWDRYPKRASNENWPGAQPPT
jgi:hypothetical protein